MKESKALHLLILVVITISLIVILSFNQFFIQVDTLLYFKFRFSLVTSAIISILKSRFYKAVFPAVDCSMIELPQDILVWPILQMKSIFKIPERNL